MTSSTADRGSDDVRLAWETSGNQTAGVWWPRSRDAGTELGALLPQVSDHLGGSVTRVSLNISAWDADQPRRLRVRDHLVRLGWFRTMDPATVTLACSGGARVTLRAVPPELDPDEARELLRGASGSSA
jgi:hypothetical protein